MARIGNYSSSGRRIHLLRRHRRQKRRSNRINHSHSILPLPPLLHVFLHSILLSLLPNIHLLVSLQTYKRKPPEIQILRELLTSLSEVLHTSLWSHSAIRISLLLTGRNVGSRRYYHGLYGKKRIMSYLESNQHRPRCCKV